MRQQSLRSTVPNWLKIFVGIIIGVFIVFLSYSIYLYQNNQADKFAGYEETEFRIANETKITEIDAITRYHGDEFYHVIEGRTSNGDEVLAYVLIEDDAEQDIQVYYLKDLISSDQIMSEWRSHTDVRKLMTVQYGYRGSTPLLEFIYIDENDRLSYDYYRLDDGTFYSGISFSD